MVVILYVLCVNAQQKAKQTTLIDIFSKEKVEELARNFL